MTEIWTHNEENLLLALLQQGYSISQCLECFPKRSFDSLAAKRSRLRKRNWEWGRSHLREKKVLLEKWLKIYRPKRVFEAYAGRGELTEILSQYAESVIAAEKSKIVLNDALANLKNKTNIQFIPLPADKALYKLLSGPNNTTFDWVDLDPFGAVINIFPNAVKVVDNGYLSVTLTDLHLFRFRGARSQTWRFLLQEDIVSSPLDEQISYLLGWMIFDVCRTVYFTRAGKQFSKIIAPKHINYLGPRHERVIRVLFRVDRSASTKVTKDFLQDTILSSQGEFSRPFFDVTTIDNSSG